ncbi:NAD(P)-dependent dehydrogenase, short-chain alcohol dehydrogenase family [Fodinibius roseus]|uniref:NAD(P)-dependent dehydrogenase, short-chain alcohol dehydrogenase family n=1 Tax=Fodinibius roseus TaxID=1194090 RepID=A0A1M5G4Y2_9BACT|nr:SDR family oxidoreductase [Fodinibius roseus]SHF98786.1 NAD(P)-dependent dehydrogenase, short-chain alcohol dehydrogenase family [Fodinibius roseus]
MNKLFDLSGKTAIVTGGNGVLGGAMAEGIARAGARVAILGRTEETVNRQVETIEQNGGEALPLYADVLNTSDLRAAKQKVLDEWGQIDILINAAGGNIAGAVINPDQSFLDLDDKSFEKVVDLNFHGTYLPTKIFSEPMIETEKGTIINISSMAAQKIISRVIGYSAAKAAIDNFTKSLSVELANKHGEGLRVNAIAPGFFIGKQNRDLLLKGDGSLTDRGQTIVDHTPMDRFGEAEELIGTAVWLASDASKFVTGTIIPVDGGFSAYSGV